MYVCEEDASMHIADLIDGSFSVSRRRVKGVVETDLEDSLASEDRYQYVSYLPDSYSPAGEVRTLNMQLEEKDVRRYQVRQTLTPRRRSRRCRPNSSICGAPSCASRPPDPSVMVRCSHVFLISEGRLPVSFRVMRTIRAIRAPAVH